jgi:3-deoxy-manno-octulosonate cytidylyltransferase (CMP-KDO synthetase)
MSVVIVIPARYGSTRFPGKPLAPILGKTLLQRTWLIAKAVKGADSVLIATDDDRICQHALSFGAEVQMTPTNCTNGTERCLSALSLRKLRPEIVINLQGDAVLTPPAVIEPLIAALTKNWLNKRLPDRQVERSLLSTAKAGPSTFPSRSFHSSAT